MELVRDLLISIEGHEKESRWLIPEELDSPAAKAHLELMEQADLIKLSASRTDVIVLIYDVELTWNGHDYLNAIRSNTVWSKVKENAKEKGLQITEIPFSLIKDYAVFVGKGLLGME